ncbi:MAG TPA: NAD(P)-binding domain-containing protein [Anaerolineales bacterium]|jgi:putative flavoprotein involved in K+ transport
METVETIIIGAGQAGLALSYLLQAQSREHLVLEKSDRSAHVWTDDRWDSFTINTPNWSMRMPGAEYSGPHPDGFMGRQELAGFFDSYAQKFKLPIRYGTSVTSVGQLPVGQGFELKTGQGDFRARNVVVATGLFQRPKIPVFAGEVPPGILQLHSGHYRNPSALPPGAVLVAGSGQSGTQIAEELYLAGRKVYLCVGSAGRVPRRYRGKDSLHWLVLNGFFDRTIDKLPSPKAKFAGNPQLSGNDGGRTLNLHKFARDGVRLLGRINGAHDGRISLAPGLHESLAKVDKIEEDLVKQMDEYILKNGIDAPEDVLPRLRDGYETEELVELDLSTAGIGSVVWAIGYTFDFDLVKLPVTDGDGYPIQQRGVTQYPGLYFLGLPWLYKFKSGLLLGVGEDAQYLAERITAK